MRIETNTKTEKMSQKPESVELSLRDKIIEFQNKLSMRIEQLAQHQSEYENESRHENAMICAVKLRELEFVHSQLNKVLD